MKASKDGEKTFFPGKKRKCERNIFRVRDFFLYRRRKRERETKYDRENECKRDRKKKERIEDNFSGEIESR